MKSSEFGEYDDKYDDKNYWKDPIKDVITVLTGPGFVSIIVAFGYTIAWDGQYCYLGLKYTLTFLDGIRSEHFLLLVLLFTFVKILVLSIRTLRDSVTFKVWVEALGRRGAVEI